jgi:hypothetical protein
MRPWAVSRRPNLAPLAESFLHTVKFKDNSSDFGLRNWEEDDSREGAKDAKLGNNRKNLC